MTRYKSLKKNDKDDKKPLTCNRPTICPFLPTYEKIANAQRANGSYCFPLCTNHPTLENRVKNDLIINTLRAVLYKTKNI
jgi:hypothetical protein